MEENKNMKTNNELKEKKDLTQKAADSVQEINVFERFSDDLEKEMKKLGHVNLVIAGKTGVGKSTLINAVFGEDLAKTGVGKPVTEGIKEYSREGFPLRLYDTMGLELSEERQAFAEKQIKDLCKEKKLSEKASDHLHIMWYCVHGNGARLEEYEKNFINSIAEEMPVVIVLTQCLSKQNAIELRDAIEKMDINYASIVAVRAKAYNEDGIIAEVFGLEKLINDTYNILPSAVKRAFTNAQIASLKVKENMAYKIVLATTGAAFTEGFSPIPFSDAILLVPTEIGMLAAITAVYGMKVEKAVIAGMVTSLLGSTGATVIGKTLTSNLIKMIPGAGTALGGLISGSVATMLTAAMGATYIQVLNKIFKGEIEQDDLLTPEGLKIVTDIFKEQMIIAKKKEKEEK